MWFFQKQFLILLSFLIFEITHCKKAKKLNSNGNCNTCGISSAGKSLTKKIINGKEINQENKYPWLVSIMRNGKIFCGGAIISSRFILTAAHCLLTPNAVKEPACLRKRIQEACYNPPEVFQVGVLSPNGIREAIQVVKVIKHPRFSIDDKVHDIGLMKLNRRIECGRMSLPICLPRKNMNKFGQNLIVAGWGKYSENPSEKKMREGNMTQVQNEACLSNGETPKKARNYLCAVGTQTNQKSCFGDSGSSIFSKFGDKYFALGVTSFGISKVNVMCSLAKPAIFTRTYAYLKWIRKYVKDIPRD